MEALMGEMHATTNCRPTVVDASVLHVAAAVVSRALLPFFSRSRSKHKG